MNYQAVIKKSPVQGFKALLARLEQISKNEYKKSPHVKVDLKNGNTYYGIVLEFGKVEGEEMVLMLSSTVDYNGRYSNPDTCHYFLFNQIAAISICNIDTNGEALRIITLDRFEDKTLNDVNNKLSFLRLAEDYSRLLTDIISNPIKITVEESFFTSVHDYATAGVQLNNIFSTFKAIAGDSMGIEAIKEKVNEINLVEGAELTVKMENKKMQFLITKNDLNELTYFKPDFKTPIESLL